MERQRCKVTLHVEIVYKAEACFRSFVQDHFSQRLLAKARGDEVSQLMYKLQMNSCYGKFGQRPQVGNFVGSLQQTLDFVASLLFELKEEHLTPEDF